MKRAWFVVFGWMLVACDKGESIQSEAPKGEAPKRRITEPMKKAESFGGPVTEKLTPLGAIVKTPGDFRNKTIATSGVVEKVCSERGCWMSINADGADAMVRMHDHAFFVPPGDSTKGRFARVQGTVKLKKDGKECEESNLEDVQVELDATGVELDPSS